MYYATVAAAALHQVLLRTMTKALRDDNVVAQNVASGLFCALFVALGVVNRPTLLATSMLGYLISDSTSVTTASYAAHHAVTAMLLLVSLRGEGAYDDLTVVLGGYGEDVARPHESARPRGLPELARLPLSRDAVGRPRIGSGREPL